MSSPDAGAREIRRLLTTPDPALGSALRAVVGALRRGLKPGRGATPGVEISRAAVDGVEKTQSLYRGLRMRIAAIETQRADAKRRVLSALDLLDSSLTLFARSLTASSNRKIAELARQAYWQREHAHAELSRAVRELR